MGVYIKGMKMPKDCMECWNKNLHVVIDCEEFLTVFNPDGYLIPDTCPLVEVAEPHGDLIDADRLRKEHNIWVGDGIAPTVIEAEE